MPTFAKLQRFSEEEEKVDEENVEEEDENVDKEEENQKENKKRKRKWEYKQTLHYRLDLYVRVDTQAVSAPFTGTTIEDQVKRWDLKINCRKVYWFVYSAQERSEWLVL